MKNIDRQRLASLIRGIEGISNDDRSALLELVNTRKKYGLVWEDKPENVEERLREELPVLTEVKERAIINGGDNPNHILIEGDNLEALTALSYTHEGKVDVIYIDPPYNTGHEDFMYNDDFVDVEDSYRHSKWLSFMEKRLTIAKRLLSEKGVIFISIDDNEQANLKLLCDEVFGSQNFVETFLWNKTSTPPALSYKSRKTHEYVLCYVKFQNSDKFVGLINEGGDAPLLNETNREIILNFPANYVTTNLADGVYASGPRERVELLNEVNVCNGVITTAFSLKGHFRWQQSTLDEEIHNNCLLKVKSNKFAIRYCRQGDRTVAPPNFISSRFYESDTTIDRTNQDVDTNEQAGKELVEILGSKKFDFPKPTSLISYLISFNNNHNSVVLDFFAGSGTTMQAVMQRNKKDGGHRQCILVTNNENNICEEVTYERNKRVINGYTTPRGAVVEGLKDNNLRYYKTYFISRERTNTNMRALVKASTDLLCIKEDLYDEEMMLGSIKLKPSLARLFKKDDRQMLVIYREEVVGRIVEELEKIEFKEKLKIYLFSPGRYAFDDEFYTVQDKVTLCALPAAIYDAYQKVLPKRKAKLLPEFEEKQNDELNFEEGRNE